MAELQDSERRAKRMRYQDVKSVLLWNDDDDNGDQMMVFLCSFLRTVKNKEWRTTSTDRDYFAAHSVREWSSQVTNQSKNTDMNH